MKQYIDESEFIFLEKVTNCGRYLCFFTVSMPK